MFGRRSWWVRTGSVVALAMPFAHADAAPKSAAATGTSTIILPVSVTKTKDMVFGALSRTAAGTAVLEPNADVLTTTGGVVSLGGSPHSAEFVGAAQSSSVVNIKLPNQGSTLTRAGGTETMSLTNFTLQGQSKRTLAKQSSFTFRVGGTLNVAANQAEGLYVGTFNVTVQYP